MKDAGHHLSVLEVSHTDAWVTVSTASKELQDQTNGEAGSVWPKEEPLITAKLMRRSPQHISYQSVWTGVSHAAKLEQGYLNVRDAMKDIERIMGSLCHARFDEKHGRSKR
jgi:hypothetical protein